MRRDTEYLQKRLYVDHRAFRGYFTRYYHNFHGKKHTPLFHHDWLGGATSLTLSPQLTPKVKVARARARVHVRARATCRCKVRTVRRQERCLLFTILSIDVAWSAQQRIDNYNRNQCSSANITCEFDDATTACASPRRAKISPLSRKKKRTKLDRVTTNRPLGRRSPIFEPIAIIEVAIDVSGLNSFVLFHIVRQIT